MSKDTINPKRWILTQADLDAYEEWIIKRDNFNAGYCGRDNFKEIEADWLRLNPCPLPNPVEIPSEKDYCLAALNTKAGPQVYDGFIRGAKWLIDLIFNKQ